MLEMRIHGRGGQGVVTLAELLGKAALKAGQEVQTLPFFGVERRGAAVKAAVRFDTKPIKVHSQSYHPHILVLMNQNLLPIGLGDGIAQEGIIISNGTHPLAIDQKQWLVDATGIALDSDLVIGGEPFINVPMLGALARILEIPFPLVEETIREQWTEKKALPNVRAAQKSYESVKVVQGGAIHD
ncbi:2-oxoacid:acceptor oxidoreductase family protein [Dehalobacterium formicoaceticum]|uniref:2-oxoacid:acceptor oxidoreductase family protein n=1 Tax=Dehalobacterium formicoaceticum TaxID=51515 RepID=A0ABT1Y2J5_9FIRM|nr:2-oxoacid:acceptor oxidoreductase family protein [Dehalobacterium formicoaceticum]MCR6545085.1 2-oxoacid:acceptor oxidoreductase family protein [Dehalobacterium formicoaceticum]